MELTQTGFLKKLAGKSFTTESGIDACVTFINCGIIRDRINLYSEIRQERILLNRVAEVLIQSFQVRGENLTLLDFMEKQTLEKRCFVLNLRCQASISDHDEIIKNSELY